jgi:hypothetical protein
MSTLPSIARRCLVLAVALLLVLPAAPPAAAASTTELGAATPQELVARVTKAAEARDFAELAACLAPEDRAAMSLMLVLGAGMMVAFSQMGAGLAEGMAEGMAEAFGAELEQVEESPEAAAARAAETERLAGLTGRYEELLERHGIAKLMEEDPEPEATGPEAAAKLLASVDQVALIADLMGFMGEVFPEAAEEEPVAVPVGELTDLVIDGDTARGRIGGEEGSFVRVDGRWFLAMEEDEEGGEGEDGEDAGDPSDEAAPSSD